MKKRASLLLLLSGLGIVLTGCSAKETLKTVLRKGKEIVKTGVEKTVEALDNFFEESNPDKQEEEEKKEESSDTTPATPGENEGEPGEGDAGAGNESVEGVFFVELR